MIKMNPLESKNVESNDLILSSVISAKNELKLKEAKDSNIYNTEPLETLSNEERLELISRKLLIEHGHNPDDFEDAKYAKI